MIKRIATLLLGIGLIGLGVLLFVAPGNSSAVQMLVRFWPLFLVLAGIVRLLGFLIDRHPKSPVGGMLITTVGGILLSANLLGHNSFLLLIGKYWFWLLSALIAGRVMKQYLHRPQDGPRPNAFAPGAVAAMILILVSGLGAAYMIKTGKQPELRLGSLGEVGDLLFAGERTVEDKAAQFFPVKPDSRLIVNHINGEIEVTTAPQPQATARLVKRIRSGSDEEANEIAKAIQLEIISDGDDHQLSIKADGVERDFSTSLIVTLPRQTVAHLEINARHCRVTLGEINGNVAIQAERSRIRVEGVNGDLAVVSNDGDPIVASRIRGSLRIKAENGAVEVEDMRGQATIEADGNVRVTDFQGPLQVNVERGTISLETSEAIRGEIKASSDRGRIRLSIPRDSEFRLDACADRGRVLLGGFEEFTPHRRERSVLWGYNRSDSAPLVNLRSGRGDIQVQSSGLALAGAEDGEQRN